MKGILNEKWLKASLIRALRTFCQSLIATIGTSAILSEVNWGFALSASILSAVLSILTSFAGLPEAKDDDE